MNLTVTENAKALARAVLAGDATAIAGLLDEVQAECDLAAAREWLATWDGYARAALPAVMAEAARHTEEGQGAWSEDDAFEHNASIAATQAHAMMRVRAEWLRFEAGKIVLPPPSP